MPDFDTRRPQESDEPNGLRSRSLTNRVRNSLITNRLRTLLIGGGVLLFVVVGISVGLVMYSFGGPGALMQEPLGKVPNGKIAFLKADRDIYVTNPDGTGARNLTDTSGEAELIPAWSPDGEKIAFESAPPYDLFVMNADGSGMTQLTNTLGVDELIPAWSPDGERIAFESGPEDTTVGDIFVMNADGTGRMRLTNTAEWREITPTWSPDGEYIAFWSGSASGGEICLTKADGSTGRRCVANDVAEDEPPYNPVLAWGRG